MDYTAGFSIWLQDAIGQMIGYLLATLFFASVLVMTVATVIILALSSLFSLLIHDYVSNSTELASLACVGSMLLIPVLARGNRDASLVDIAALLSGSSLLMGVIAAMLGHYSMLLLAALCVLCGVPLAVCWWSMCMIFPDWMRELCVDLWSQPWRNAAAEPLLATEPVPEPQKVPDLESLMEVFFLRCYLAGRELMKRDELWLTREDLEEMMPGVVVGLPAVALLQIVQEALARIQGVYLEALAELRPEMAESLFIEARVLWEDTEAPASSSFKEGIKVAARSDIRRRTSRLIGFLGLGRTLPAGHTGHVLRVLAPSVVEVQWDGSDAVCSRHSIRDLALEESSPRQLKAAARGEPMDAQRRQLAVQAAGRLRSVALFFTRMPFFQQHFRTKVVEPLIRGHDTFLTGGASPVKMRFCVLMHDTTAVSKTATIAESRDPVFGRRSSLRNRSAAHRRRVDCKCHQPG
eukprot:s653_g8.t2